MNYAAPSPSVHDCMQPMHESISAPTAPNHQAIYVIMFQHPLVTHVMGCTLCSHLYVENHIVACKPCETLRYIWHPWSPQIMCFVSSSTAARQNVPRQESQGEASDKLVGLRGIHLDMQGAIVSHEELFQTFHTEANQWILRDSEQEL
jgi:hypothetical protein